LLGVIVAVVLETITMAIAVVIVMETKTIARMPTYCVDIVDHRKARLVQGWITTVN
jgi:hypothetical protein